MGLTEFYHSLEDKYYNFMDGLEAKGIKMYEWFINPIEDHGLPSMPVFLVGVLLVLGVLAFAAVSLTGGSFPGLGGNGLSVAVKVSGPDGAALDGIIVKLSGGAYASSAKTKNGVANFDSVPYAKTMTVSVNQDGYAAFTQDFAVASGKPSATFSVQLQKSSGGSGQSVVLFVSDNNQFPLSQAQVRFQDPTSGNFVTEKTDAQGKVTLSLASSDVPVSLSISHDGYDSNTISCPIQSTTCQVTLTPSASGGGGNGAGSGGSGASGVSGGGAGGTGNVKSAAVRVELVDQANGTGLSGKVTLFRNDNGQTLDSSLTDGQGVARFDNIPLGIDVYVVFTPDNKAYAVFTSDSKTSVEATNFFIQLPAKNSSNGGTNGGSGGTDFSKVSVQAVDVKQNPISGAQMRLYVSAGSLRPMSDQVSADDSGKVSFDIDPSAHVYATVWAPGFLPARTRVLTGGEFTQQVLQPVLVGNHGSLNVTVLDDAGAVVSGASVSLQTSDGFPVGIPAADTHLDGAVNFDNLPLSSFRAIAAFGPQSGQSDAFTISLEPHSATVILKPATAFISVKAFDATAVNPSGIPSGFIASLSSTGAVLGSCSSNGSACSIQVPANRNVVVTANATGYSGLSSEAITVAAGATFSKSFYLLPSSLSSSLLVTSAAVLDQDGHNVTVLDKGRVYSFVLTFNLPSNAQKAGAFVRVGNVAEASSSPLVINSYSQPSDATPVKGQKFNPGPSCAGDLGNQNGPIQWVDWSYAQFGSKTASADLFIKPTATSKDQLVIQYRLYAKAGSAFIRSPEDPIYGGNETTAEFDSCYAKTVVLPLKFVDGKSTCNDNACISYKFQSNTSSASTGLRVNAGDEFNVSLDLRAFNPLNSPLLKIRSDPAVEFTGYDFGGGSLPSGPQAASGQLLSIPLSFDQRLNGTVRMRALLPTVSSNLRFTFGDSSGVILDDPKPFVVVQGTGQFTLVPTPLSIESLKDNLLTVFVLSDQGIPVTNAKLTLDEVDGSPFGGFANGPIAVGPGDGSPGNGQDGKYQFKNLRPSSVGQFSITASRPGFQDGSALVGVNASSPLGFDQDTNNVQLDCKNPTPLKVRSAVGAELKVAASFSGTGCANVKVISGGSASTLTSSVNGTSGTVSFRVKPDKDTSVLLSPALDGSCTLTFNAQTLSGLTLGSSDVGVFVACFGNATATPVGSVTPIPSQDCASLGGVCAASANACPAGYAGATATASASSSPLCASGGFCCVPPSGSSCTSQGGICAPAGSACPSGYASNFNGVLGGQASCQSMGGTCASNGACPSGQYALPGACAGNGVYGGGVQGTFGGAVCCGVSPRGNGASPTAPTCANGGTCCQNVNNLCQPPVFNFQNILAKYLGYYLNAQALSTYPQQVTASSAPTQLIASQSGIQVSKPGSCTTTANGLDCKKNIYALLPTNAMAFSVQNSLFTETRIETSLSSSTCYALQEIGSQSGLGGIYNGIVNNVVSGAALPTRQVRTYVISFKPSPQCVSYSTDTSTGIFHAVPTEIATKGTEIRITAASTFGNQAFTIKFHVENIGDDSDKYAFIVMPKDGNTITLRGLKDKTYEEPAIFANNIPVNTFGAVVKVGSSAPVSVPADKAIPIKMQLTESTTPQTITIQLGTASSNLKLDVKREDAPAGLDSYDVVGNTIAGTDALSCSGADFCTPETVGSENEKGVLFTIKNELNAFAQRYVNDIDTLATDDPLGLNGGNGQAYQQLYQQALQAAVAEYSALRNQYQACLAQGQDPLAQTRTQCAQNGIAPIYGYPQTLPGSYGPQGFNGAYGGQYSGMPGLYGAGGLGAVNPQFGGAGTLGNPYAANLYPGAGLYPGYVTNPQVQQNIGNAFGAGWQQAGCNSDILNAFQLQGQIGPFGAFQQQMIQQYSLTRGQYSNRKPVIAGLQPTIAVPIKVAGVNGGIIVYTFKADMTSAAGTAGDFVQVGYMNSGNYNGLTSTFPTSTAPKGSTTPTQKYGFPYLKLNDAKTVYELQNFNAGNTVYPAYSPTDGSNGQPQSSNTPVCSYKTELNDAESCDSQPFGTPCGGEAKCTQKTGAPQDSDGNYPCACS